MANEKNFMTWKRQHRHRKSAKAKVKLYEQGKLTHDKLPAIFDQVRVASLAASFAVSIADRADSMVRDSRPRVE